MKFIKRTLILILVFTMLMNLVSCVEIEPGLSLDDTSSESISTDESNIDTNEKETKDKVTSADESNEEEETEENSDDEESVEEESNDLDATNDEIDEPDETDETDDDTEINETTPVTDETEDTETKKPSNTERPTETNKPSGTEKPTQTEKPIETEKPTETDKPAETDKTTETDKPADPPAVEPTKTPVSAEIVNKNGAKGVLTLISDDGDQRTADFFYTKVAPKYSAFKITIALPTYKVATLSTTNGGKEYQMNSSGGYSMKEFLANNYTAMSGSVLTKSSLPKMTDFWKKVTDTGAIEIASHSHSHGPWPAHDNLEMNGNTVVWPKGSAIKELRASAQIIRNALKQETPFIMRPGGTFMTTEVSTYLKSLFNTDNTYLGMRSSNGAPPLPSEATSANSAKLNTVAKFKKQDGRLTIATLLVRGYEAAYNSSKTGFATDKNSSKSAVQSAGISAWKQYVDYAMQYGQWGSIAFHAVVADSDTAEGYEVYDKQVMALMDYVQPLVDSGDLWLAHFAEAAKYYFEWSSATVSATLYDNDYIEVSLNDKETDERFDEALTVKLEIPTSWKTAKLTTAGKTSTLTIHTDTDGSHFVYANIVPSENISVVKP